MSERSFLIVEPSPNCEPEIGRMLWMLEDARRRTRRALEGVIHHRWIG
jgi:hypothetical protein